MHTGFRWEEPRKRGHFEDQGNGSENIIKMDIQEVGWGGMDWIDLAQNMDRGWAVVNAVMNLWIY